MVSTICDSIEEEMVDDGGEGDDDLTLLPPNKLDLRLSLACSPESEELEPTDMARELDEMKEAEEEAMGGERASFEERRFEPKLKKPPLFSALGLREALRAEFGEAGGGIRDETEDWVELEKERVRPPGESPGGAE